MPAPRNSHAFIGLVTPPDRGGLRHLEAGSGWFCADELSQSLICIHQPPNEDSWLTSSRFLAKT
jgi:hypothetical protein